VNHRLRTHALRQRGATAFAVLLTLAILIILSHNLFQIGLVDYRNSAQVRDTIVLQQLTDSALAQAIYYLNRGDRTSAAAPVREPFGVALIEIGGATESPTVRIVVHAPDAERPRMTSRTLFHLKRDSKGRWTVISAGNEPLLSGE